MRRILAAVLVGTALLACEPGFADPFKLEVQEQGYIQQQQAYPAPQMVNPPMQGGTSLNRQGQQGEMDAAPQSRSMSGSARQVALPNDFLGAWAVSGQRTKVEAQPEFAAAANQAFAPATNDTWQIRGNAASGYSLSSSTGASMPLIVDKVEGQTAFIRYQHPIGKTMAQEAVVMQLVSGNIQFNGLERISIVKQGMPEPRARVTYKLVGRRR
jgi:hypothetical protein